MLVGVLPPVALLRVAGDADVVAARGEVPATAPVVAPTARVATPLVSVRRLPGLVSGADPAQELRTQLGALAADLNVDSCLAVSVGGAPVFAVNQTAGLIPASNTKLVTSAVALEVLGPEHTFATSVVAVAGPDAAGSVNGDLHLVGGGDPLLTTAAYRELVAADPMRSDVPFTSLEALADAVAAAGVRRVAGDVVGDDARYDRRYYVPQLRAELQGTEVGPSSALAVDDGLRQLSPRAASTEPATTAAATFARLLAERGVVVAGQARAGGAPRDATTALAAVRSAPLRDVVHQVLASSDDDAAELLVKEIGLAARGTGSSEAGLAAIAEQLAAWLTEAGVPTDGIVLYDGSGLVSDNRLSCAALLTVIGRAPLDGPLVQGLAVAGVHGTLVGNLKGTVAEGRLRAKTGALQSVDTRTLTGVWPVDDGTGALRFSFLLRVPGIASPVTAVDAYWSRLAAALGTYPYRPDLTPYAPRPALP